MEEKLRAHIDKLFEDAPRTRKAIELKEELLANSEERYQDLLADGVSPEDAYKHVISSIGNVSELFQGLEDLPQESELYSEDMRKKYAMLNTAAVGLYLFSFVLFMAMLMLDGFISSNVSFTSMGLVLMLLIDIIPTCILVYINSMYPKYTRKSNTVVEEFKEWNDSTRKVKSIKGTVIFIGWTFIVLLYFIISFSTFAWYVTWIIFLAGICVHAIIELIFRLKEMKQ